MSAEADAIEDRTAPPVGDEGDRRRRQDPPDRSPRGFEHEQDRQTAERDVDGQGVGGAIDEAAEVEDRPRRARRPTAPTSAQSRARRGRRARRAPRREEQKDQDQRDEQEADAVDLRLDDEEDPVERVEREADGEAGRESARRIRRSERPCDSWSGSWASVTTGATDVRQCYWWPSARRSTASAPG